MKVSGPKYIAGSRDRGNVLLYREIVARYRRRLRLLRICAGDFLLEFVHREFELVDALLAVIHFRQHLLQPSVTCRERERDRETARGRKEGGGRRGGGERESERERES